MGAEHTRRGNEMTPPSIRENYIYNLIYQVMTLLTPFITTPYISRVLGPEGTGVQSYTASVAQYFVIAAAMGTAAYGQREIARNRDDRAALSRTFWEIECLCAATTALCLVIWIGLIGFSRRYAPYYAALTMTLLAVPLDISWLFGGMERYGLIAVRNIAVKLAGIVCMFLFVKSSQDLLLYVALLAATGLLGNLSMWAYLRRFVDPADWRTFQVKRHLKETMIYFVPTIATSVYTILDKTMIGWFTGESKTQNGYYEYATGFVNMGKILIISFNSVMSARMSYLFAVEKTEEIRSRIRDSLNFILLLALPIALGLAGIAKGFVPWFLGKGYEPVAGLLYMLCPLVLIVGLSDCMGSQLLTPGGQRAKSAKVIVAGACLNFAMNLALIPRFSSAGAAAASLLAELFITGMYLYLCRDYIRPGMLIKLGWKRFLAASVMLAAVLMLDGYPKAGAASTVLQVAAGALVYFLLLYLLQDDFLIRQTMRLMRGRRGEE